MGTKRQHMQEFEVVAYLVNKQLASSMNRQLAAVATASTATTNHTNDIADCAALMRANQIWQYDDLCIAAVPVRSAVGIAVSA